MRTKAKKLALLDWTWSHSSKSSVRTLLIHLFRVEP